MVPPLPAIFVTVLVMSRRVHHQSLLVQGGFSTLSERSRVVAADPEILILDEATASIDPETEPLIQQGLHRITEGRTSILIAHRLLTLREADRIVVMQHGRIVATGSHEELLARDGVYRTLYELQFGEEAA